MKLLKRILVATDFGHAADDAVRTASYVARSFDSTVDLLHVRSPGPKPADSIAEPHEKLSEQLDACARRMASEGVRSVEVLLVEGDAFGQIERYAEQRGANVIMVGAGQRGPGGRVFLGTTAARLRRWAMNPVWIVKPEAGPPIRRILCPVDMQPASARALKNAIHFARRLDAELTVLHVTPDPLGESGSEHQLRGEPAVGTPESYEPHLPEFDQFLRSFDFHQVCCQKIIRRGKPQDEVGQVARETEADLIVMGSTGRTGLSRMFVGGVARRVAQELPCSIITVRSHQPIELDAVVPQLDVDLCASHPPRNQCDRFQHGEELLSSGLAEEAIGHFNACVAHYKLCANAWLRLCEAHTRLGDYEKARHCAAHADEALRRQENQRIEEDLRGKHILYRRIFGI
jgi:nucleotide-binding universal stress UspA family protein